MRDMSRPKLAWILLVAVAFGTATLFVSEIVGEAAPPERMPPSTPSGDPNMKDQPASDEPANPAVRGRVPDDQLPKTDEEWARRLTPEQFQVARKKGTERAFTGKFWNTTAKGTYRCVCCGEPLFESGQKFESGCGWPSFSKPLEKARVAEHDDFSLFMHRTEVTCRRCGAHLGHVFEDGPPPTGLRYCINSASLVFDEE